MSSQSRLGNFIDLTEEVAESANVPQPLASKLISMFDQGFTVPFIARYRKEATGGMEPVVLHRLKEKISHCRNFMDKMDKSLKYLDKNGLLTEDLTSKLSKCKTSDELKLLTDPFISKGPRTLSARAKAVNLNGVAEDILYSGKFVDIVKKAPFEATQAFPNKSDLEQAVSHIIADVFSKDLDVIRHAEHLCTIHAPRLQTSAKRTVTKAAKTSKTGRKIKKENVPMQVDTDNSKPPLPTFKSSKDDLVTFKNYLNFSRPVNQLFDHQILAINRASERGVISSKVVIPPVVQMKCWTFVSDKYLPSVNLGHHIFLHSTFEDSWRRLIEPHLIRTLRCRLTSSAHETSLEVFTDNLRRLLMTSPLRANDLGTHQRPPISPGSGVISSASAAPGDRLPVIGIDPGWRNGCKWAACDPHGGVLATGLLWPPTTTNRPLLSGNQPASQSVPASTGLRKLVDVMNLHGIQTIALGNGQASRQTGQWLSSLIASGHFLPLTVRYAVVSEAGASYYSASALATSELPDLDVTLRGAVSIARRLQDPLAELVKLEPKHLGVGMYQHDVPERRLEAAVGCVMEECISFVGVDINAAPLHLLARVAGLSEAKAKAIIQRRNKVGAFRTRNDVRQIKGIGPVTFAQCAGFIRVRPTYSATALDGTRDVEMISISSDDNEDVEMSVKPGGKRARPSARQSKSKRAKRTGEGTSDPTSFNPLDQTAVHPDAYDVATSIITELKCQLTDVGQPKLRTAAEALATSPDREFPVKYMQHLVTGDQWLARFCDSNIGMDTLRDIVEALSRQLDFDERSDCFLPLFHAGAVMSIAELRSGMQVTGRVENVTTFGAFCDIGVQQDAYIPRHSYPRRTGANGVEGGGRAGGLFSLRLGDRLTATVKEVNPAHDRIVLHAISLLL